MGPGSFYSIFQWKGRDSATAYTMRKEQRAQGVPPNWMVYIAVDSADSVAAKAADLGGTILAPAFDVMDAGRMAVVQDPTGAVFSAWQAKNSKGLGVKGEDNAFCWADLNTSDPARASKFYSGLLGWTLTKGEKDTSGYLHIKNGEEFIGGIPPAHPESPFPPHWLIYFQVADVDATAAKAIQKRGKLLMAPHKIENVGTMAIVADPHGAVFALFKSGRGK